MINRYFRVGGNNSMDFMYANIAVKNIYFALERMRDCITTNPIFDSAWVTEISTEHVE